MVLWSDSKSHTVYPKKYAHGFCFAVLCCGYTLTDFPISTRLTSLALWQSNDCPSASKVTLMNMDKYFMWIHYERLHNHNKAKHNKTVCIFLGIYCNNDGMSTSWRPYQIPLSVKNNVSIPYCVLRAILITPPTSHHLPPQPHNPPPPPPNIDLDYFSMDICGNYDLDLEAIHHDFTNKCQQ